MTCDCGCEYDNAFCGRCGWLDCECGGDEPDDCQHEWELRSEHDLWVCAWCSAEVTTPSGAPS